MKNSTESYSAAEAVKDEHILLVTKIAKHMTGRLPSSVKYEDLVQSGMVGLLEAMNNFDDSKGASFSTFASIRIKGAMIDELRRGDWAPRSVHRNSRRILDAIRMVENETGRDAKDADVAEKMGVSLDEYHNMLQDTNGVRVCELEDTSVISDDGLGTFFQQTDSPLEAVKVIKYKEQLAEQVSKLPQKERLVLALYYEEDLNLKEVGEVLGVTESRISQIHSQAVLRLKSRLSASDDQD
ncbi:MAG: RNA polymerase sigma factor FliA [Legionellales bacterium]|nr:RNA polymerase sigma factor FliA [Legionellales bacterium]